MPATTARAIWVRSAREEMLRQIRHILGADRVDFSVMSQNFEFSQGLFRGHAAGSPARYFSAVLVRRSPRHHGVVACEGSMFKSKFANALTTMMIGSLGIAAAQNKLSVGYGAEAGHMDPWCQDVRPLLQKFAGDYAQRRIARRSARTRSSHRARNRYGLDLRTTPCGIRQSILRQAGWDGTTPVLVVCPINPFEWPVKASVAKYAIQRLTGAYKDSHYRTVYFHNSGPAAERTYKHIGPPSPTRLKHFARRETYSLFLAATERLDARPANKIAEKLGGVPVFTSDSTTCTNW